MFVGFRETGELLTPIEGEKKTTEMCNRRAGRAAAKESKRERENKQSVIDDGIRCSDSEPLRSVFLIGFEGRRKKRRSVCLCSATAFWGICLLRRWQSAWLEFSWYNLFLCVLNRELDLNTHITRAHLNDASAHARTLAAVPRWRMGLREGERAREMRNTQRRNASKFI